jgi:hypothetical protein
MFTLNDPVDASVLTFWRILIFPVEVLQALLPLLSTFNRRSKIPTRSEQLTFSGWVPHMPALHLGLLILSY